MRNRGAKEELREQLLPMFAGKYSPFRVDSKLYFCACVRACLHVCMCVSKLSCEMMCNYCMQTVKRHICMCCVCVCVHVSER